MVNIAKAAASKVTSQTAKNIATKVATKGLEKGAEKVGEKTGQIIGEKLYDRFGAKPKVVERSTTKPKIETKTKQLTNTPKTQENKGYEVVELLRQIQVSNTKDKDEGKSRLSIEFDKLIT